MKTCKGRGGKSPRIHNLGCIWSLMVSFTLRPVCHKWKNPCT